MYEHPTSYSRTWSTSVGTQQSFQLLRRKELTIRQTDRVTFAFIIILVWIIEVDELIARKKNIPFSDVSSKKPNNLSDS